MATNGWIKTAALGDEAVDTAALADDVLSADATGRAKVADGFITPAMLSDALKEMLSTGGRIEDGKIDYCYIG